MKQIAFITDLHLGEKGPAKKGADQRKNWQRVLEDLRARDIRQIIFGGDLGESRDIEQLFSEVRDFEFDVILGNHDSYSKIKKYYTAGGDPEELFYAKTIGSHHCIFLDSSSYKVSPRQQQFLREQLELAAKPVIFIHHPVVNIGTWMDKNHPLKNRDEVKAVIQNSPKQVSMFSGHYHLSHNVVEGNIIQVISPAVSYQILYNPTANVSDISEFGYLILDLSDEELKVEKIIFEK